MNNSLPDCARRHAPRMLALAACLAGGSAHAGNEIVLGDSLGVGVSMASGLPRLARSSVSMRGEPILEQLRRAPHGATAFLSLGMNDIAFPLRDVPANVERILETARRYELRLVWLGPPCVRRGWNHKVAALDAVLRERIARRAIYVGMTEPQFCDAKIKAADGVHFNLRGYRLMWAKARAAATDSIATGSTHPRSVTADGAGRE
jgi:lysophospholipase L1-like esterase